MRSQALHKGDIAPQSEENSGQDNRPLEESLEALRRQVALVVEESLPGSQESFDDFARKRRG